MLLVTFSTVVAMAGIVHLGDAGKWNRE